MDNNTYLIYDEDSCELIQVHTKITLDILNHIEIVQMIMIEQSLDYEEWSDITEPEDVNFKVYAVYEGNISPVYEDDLNCYVFEDKHYQALRDKIDKHEGENL